MRNNQNALQIAMGTGSLSTTNEFIHPSTAAKVAIASAAAFTFIDVNRNLTYLVRNLHISLDFPAAKGEKLHLLVCNFVYRVRFQYFKRLLVAM